MSDAAPNDLFEVIERMTPEPLSATPRTGRPYKGKRLLHFSVIAHSLDGSDRYSFDRIKALAADDAVLSRLTMEQLDQHLRALNWAEEEIARAFGALDRFTILDLDEDDYAEMQIILHELGYDSYDLKLEEVMLAAQARRHGIMVVATTDVSIKDILGVNVAYWGDTQRPRLTLNDTVGRRKARLADLSGRFEGAA